MQIAGTGITTFTPKILIGFTPILELALKWVQASDGNYYASDRGLSSDQYGSEIQIAGKEDVIDNFITQYNNNRGSFVINLSNFNLGEHIFGEDIDYSHSPYLRANMELSDKVQKSWKGFTLPIKLNLIDKFFTGSSSLPDLKTLSIGYSANTKYRINIMDSYTGSFTYQDDESENGIFTGIFIFSNSGMKSLRRFYSTQRGSSFTLTEISGVTYPFGVNRGTFPFGVKIIEMKDQGQISPNLWKARLKLAEVI